MRKFVRSVGTVVGTIVLIGSLIGAGSPQGRGGVDGPDLSGVTVESIQKVDGQTVVGLTSEAGPLPEKMSLEALQERQATQGPSRVLSSTMVAAASTPNGFRLRNPGYRVTNHVYRSNWVYQGVTKCPKSGCYIAGQVKVRLYQTVVGGASKRWRLTAQHVNVSPRRGVSYVRDADYWCGVNIKYGNDRTCTHSASRSGVDFPTNEPTHKTFERTNSVRNFPMMKIRTIFSNGITPSTSFRGCDVLNYVRTTRLAKSPCGK